MRLAVTVGLAVLAGCLPLAGFAADSGGTPTPDRAYVNAVLDSLAKQGVLTQEQVDQIKAAGEEAADQAAAKIAAKAAAKPGKKAWYDTVKIGGYTQGRFQYYQDYPNKDHSKFSNEFFLRRARFKLSFKPDDRTEVDLEADVGGHGYSIGTRDAFIERWLTADKSWRLIFGHQLVPFGFATPQSDSVALPLERDYEINSFFNGQRDTGLLFYYTNPQDKKLFDESKAKDFGAGDFGNLAFGVMNGQTADTSEANSQKSFLIHLAKPFAIGEKGYAELGTDYWRGTYHDANGQNYPDRLWGAHAFLAPNPFGLQGEYYTGQTEGGDTKGWYAMALLRTSPKGTLFLRYEKNDGTLKGKGPNFLDDRKQTALGYAQYLDPNNRLSLEYDWETVEDNNGNPGYDNNMFGVQWLTKY